MNTFNVHIFWKNVHNFLYSLEKICTLNEQDLVASLKKVYVE